MKNVKKAVVESLANGLKFTFASGREVEIAAEDFSEEVLKHAMLHGLKQKLADSYAGMKMDRDVEAAFDAVLNTLTAGLWNGGRSSSGGIWVEALARAAGVDVAEAGEKWNGMDEQVKGYTKAHPAVKQAKAEIELERAKAKAKGTEFDLNSL